MRRDVSLFWSFVNIYNFNNSSNFDNCSNSEIYVSVHVIVTGDEFRNPRIGVPLDATNT